MKYSYTWLTELVEPLTAAPRDLERLITMKTAECEGIEVAGAALEGASVARVVSVEPIEGSRNVKVVVETDRYGVKTVVCGAPNCRAGMRTVYLPVGSKSIAGVDSDGMLAAGVELGINRDHAGIVEVDGEFTLAPDPVIEVDNKSINHRPDLWGHFGIAREVAAITGGRLKDPVRPELLPAGPAVVSVTIDDYALCPRYSALVFDNVTVQPSPLWLQYRLEAIGLNPINNIVDFTNLIMAELGQPTHAFDAGLLGETIVIRPARDGESCEALNGETYTLDSTNLVIADAANAVAIAGVIGGATTAIRATTKRIVLESANFQASSIRKTSTKLRLRTDASMRFEKAQDPANTVRALARAIELLPVLSPGIRLIGGLADAARPAAPPAPIALDLDWLVRKLGRAIEPAEVRRILESLSFGVADAGPRAFSVTVPSWRATKDVAIKDDLVEEVGRMVGYDSIPPVAPALPASVPPGNPERAYLRAVRAVMTQQGFTEVHNYSFVTEEEIRALGREPSDCLAVVNPIASDQGFVRPSLLPGVLRNINSNARHFDSFRLFEIGETVDKSGDELRLAAAIFAKDDGKAGLFELKRTAECLLPRAQVTPAGAKSYEHPARAAAVQWQGKPAGSLFEFHPDAVEEGRACVLELDLRAIQQAAAPAKKYVPARRFPSSAFDLSIIAQLRELAGDVERKLTGFVPADMLERVEYVTEYSGPQVPAGTKSVSYRVTVSSPDRTLSSDDVAKIRGAVIDGLRGLGYDLRV